MILSAVFFLSLSTLAIEVLLTRVFSIAQWNHLSFMVISIALFGFGASGTFLSMLDAKRSGWEKRLTSAGRLKIIVLLYSVSASGSLLFLNQIPLDYFRLPIEAMQTLYLLLTYLALALPFFFSGLVVSLAYALLPGKTGRTYAAAMAGSALGAILPVPLLPLFGEGRLIILAAAIPLLLLLIPGERVSSGTSSGEKGRVPGRSSVFLIIAALVTAIGGFLISPYAGHRVKIEPSPYKALSHLLQFPDTRISQTATGLRGRIDSIESPYIRFAPGLSLKYFDLLPAQQAIFKDGDGQLALYDFGDNALQADAGFPAFTLTYSGYLLAPSPENVLIIQQGGGLGIACAIASGTRNITIMEQNPHIARAVRQHYGLPVVNGNPRGILARSQEKFNVIQVETWGYSLPGTAALSQEHLLTVDAVSEYLNHLSENGVLIVSRRLHLPPSDILRLFATAYESLAHLGIADPQEHIAILRDWDTFTLIVSILPIGGSKILTDFCEAMNFDVVFMEGGTADMVNRFSVFDEPYHSRELVRLAEAYALGKEERFFDNYLLDVAPQGDDRPFPNRFLKWSRLKDSYTSTGSRFHFFVMSGEIVIAAVFVEALFVALLLLLIPVLTIFRRESHLFTARMVYFLAVGAGFMFVELFFIKQYTLLFGDPVISFTVVLAGILAFSGLGGFCSQWMDLGGLKHVLLGLIALLALTLFAFDGIARHILPLPVLSQYVLALLLLLPLGFLIGIPFPLGMRRLLDGPGERAYAWAANGCASVLASIASAQIALSMGITAILAFAVVAYLLVFVSAGMHRTRGPSS